MTAMEEQLSSGTRSGLRKLLIAGTVVVLVVLAIFVPPLVNLGHYRRSIISSMSEALGRPVAVGGMELRLLPTPGIAMNDFTVEEAPDFGYEPVLHANSVVASLRLTSLWRGRLEVSRISLDEANLNLVRNRAGQWNIASVLLRASQIPNAPTAQRHAGAHPRFPYIEANDARIDFKDGLEKRPFSLMNAEFSMWQAGGGEWRLRLQAQPVRTDLELHLSDTGQLNVEGSLRRAASLDAMPVDLQADWSGAQLGQVSRMVAGFDSGWRGGLDATTTIRGDVGNLQLQSRLRIANLRRQEFQPVTAVNVDATCRSDYRHVEKLLGQITCYWPISNGHLLLTGNVEGFVQLQADLQLEINQIPAEFPVRILGLMRPHAQNVTATGTLNGEFHLTTAPRRVFAGDAIATGVALTYPGGTLELAPLHWIAETPQAPRGNVRRIAAAPEPIALLLQSLPVSMGAAEPLVASARFSRAGFELHLTGPAAVARLTAAGGNFGLFENALTHAAAKGRVELNTTTAGSWMPPLAGGSSGIVTSGLVHVQGVELQPGFLRAPVEVESADIALGPEQISWENVAFHYQAMAMHGSIRFPAVCDQPTPCSAGFTLDAGSMNAAAVEAALSGRDKNGFLGQLMADTLGRGDHAPWPPLQGTVAFDSLELGQLVVKNARATLAVEGNKLSLSSVDASALGGTLHAHGMMTLDDGVPQWNLAVAVTGATTNEVASIFHEHWGTGKMSGDATLKLRGFRMPDLVSSASGNYSLTWQNGGLAEAGTLNPAPLGRFDRWKATGTIGGSSLAVTGGGITKSGRTTPVRGSVSFDRHLDLALVTRRGPVKIGGTLAAPAVETAGGR